MRLINADALMKMAEKTLYADHPFIRFMQSQVDNAPTIDATPKWIPCEKELPELKTECLITYLSWSGNPVIDIDSYDYDGEDGWFSHMDKVIAWMPLPDPYEVEEDEY